MKILKGKGRLIVQSQIMHSYPFCWRCVELPYHCMLRLTIRFRSGVPLLYRAIPAWFVRVTPIVDELVKNNKETLW